MCSPMRKEDLDKVAALDLWVFRVPRREILEYIYELYPELCYTTWDGERLTGYIMAKKGKDSLKIGPWIAELGHEDEAKQLLYSVMNQSVGEKLWVGVPGGKQIQCKYLGEKRFLSTAQQPQDVLRRL